jgi:CHASE3 domain sensor protein
VTLRARIWILLSVAVILLLAAAVWLRLGYNRVADASTTIIEQLQPASDSVDSLNTALAEMDSGVTSYALTADITALGTYVEGAGRASNELDNLRPLVDSDPELATLLRETKRAEATWRRQGTRPIIEATRAGNQQEARQLVQSGISRNLYNDVRTYTHSMDEIIRDRVDSAVAEQEHEFLRLSQIVNGSILIFLGLLAAFALLLLRGVLKPLKDLQHQMVEVTEDEAHETPLMPSGPPELHAVGQDAEKMRRELVSEIDRARAAVEGLEQKSPVVAGIRAELANSHHVSVPGIDSFGVLHAAEGVLAGDCWSAQVLLDGQLAVTVTDVAGHGPEAVMEALRLKHTLELSLAQNADPAVALQLAAKGARNPAMPATSLIVLLEPTTGFLVWANAGHPAAWLIGEAGASYLEPTGPLISVLGGRWANHYTRLNVGDSLLMWTDGLTESKDTEGEQLGDVGLDVLVTDALAAEDTAEGLVNHILAAARSRAGDWRNDDLTLVAVRRPPE